MKISFIKKKLLQIYFEAMANLKLEEKGGEYFITLYSRPKTLGDNGLKLPVYHRMKIQECKSKYDHAQYIMIDGWLINKLDLRDLLLYERDKAFSGFRVKWDKDRKQPREVVELPF